MKQVYPYNIIERSINRKLDKYHFVLDYDNDFPDVAKTALTIAEIHLGMKEKERKEFYVELLNKNYIDVINYIIEKLGDYIVFVNWDDDQEYELDYEED